MIGKLAKSEVMKQSNPDRPGFQLHQRDSNAVSLTKFIEFLQGFCARVN
jgi:hypothetical protein